MNPKSLGEIKCCREATERLCRRAFLAGTAAVGGALAFGAKPASARIPDAPNSPVAFSNVRVFDGKSDTLRAGLRIVVEGQKIKSVEPADKPVGPGVKTRGTDIVFDPKMTVHQGGMLRR